MAEQTTTFNLENIDLTLFSKSKLSLTMGEALKENPDTFSTNLQLSEDTDIPFSAVESGPDEAKRKFDLKKFDFSRLEDDSPVTAEFLQEYSNAVVAQDDVETLGKIEKALRIARGGPIQSRVPAFVYDRLFPHQGEGLGRSIALNYNTLSKAIQIASLQSAPETIDELTYLPHFMSIQQGITMSRRFAVEHGITDESLVEAKEQRIESLIADIQENEKKRADLTPDDLGIIAEGARAAVESFSIMAPGMALSIASGGSAIAILAPMVLSTGFISFGTGLAEGLTQEEATAFGLIDGAIELITEIVPSALLANLMKNPSVNNMTKEVTRFLIAEMGFEQLATLGQSINAYAFGLDEAIENADSLAERVAIQVHRQLVTAVATAFMGPVQSSIMTAARKAIASLTEQEETKHELSEREQAALDSMDNLFPESNLKKRNPEVFKQFINSIGEDINVFIDSQKVTEYLEAHINESDPGLILLAEKLAENGGANVDITIPIAEFSVSINNTPHFEALREGMTLSSEAYSFIDQEASRAETETFIKVLIAKAQENVEEHVEAQKIYEDIQQQLIDSGRVKSKFSSVMAELVPAWAVMFAKENNISIQEAFNLTILGPESTSTPDKITFFQKVRNLFSFRRENQDYVIDVESKIAAWTPERVARFIEESESVTGENTIAMVGFINPADFLPATASKSLITDSQKRIRDETDDLDKQRLADEKQTPYLRVENGKIVRHEGRHRMVALARAGITRVPVSIQYLYNAGTPTEKIDSLTLEGQSSPGGGKGSDITISNLIPAKAENEQEILDVMGEGDLFFQPSDEIGITQGYYDTEKTLIRLTEASNLSTFIHEFAHFMYQMEVDAGSGKISAINSWFGNNTEAIANEASGFLQREKTTGDTVDQLKQESQQTTLEPALQAAKDYAKSSGLRYEPVTGHQPLNRDRGRRIAIEFENMEHDPNNPEVKAAYAAMIEETIAQFRVILQTGIKLDFIRGENPYADNPRLLISDVADNNHLAVFSTRDGFGSDETFDVSQNPLLAETEFEINGEKILVNDVFRVVHDYFGHVKNGNGFRAEGEENAWQSHAVMYSPLARRAMTTETRGQNSWVNFGPKGEQNRTASAADTVYADQKIGLLPMWVSEEGKVNDKPKADRSGRDKNGVLVRPPIEGGRITLEHFSNREKLNRLDPEFYGNRYAGTEKERVASPNWVNRTYYGVETGTPGGYTKEFGTGNVKYTTSIDAGQIYDYVANPDNISDGVGVNDFENNIRESGYSGYFISHPELGMVVAVFDVLQVESEAGVLRQTDIPGGTDTNKQSVTVQDVVTYLDKGTTGNEDADVALRTATHEQFARGFEAYIMEGKAPSIGLRRVFRIMARWMNELYQRIKGQLNVNLNDEIRGVFDRLLASKEEIDAARARRQYEPLFTDAAMAGMNEKQFAEFNEKVNDLIDKEDETLRDKLIKQLTRQSQAWWDLEKNEKIEDATESLKNERIYIAIDTLLNTDLKLDRAAVKELVGEEQTSKRGTTFVRFSSKLNNMTKTGGEGIHPDEVASILGYGSGQELLEAIITAKTIKQAANERAESEMLLEHGDILNDGSIQSEADEILNNSQRGELLLAELKALSRNKPLSSAAEIKTLAEEHIGRLTYRENHPGKYRRAELKAKGRAAVALKEGDKEAAAIAKQEQVLNFYLGVAASQAREETLSIRDKMRRYDTKKVRERIQVIDGGYWPQITKILVRFQFSGSLASVEQINEENKELMRWAIERNEEHGDALILSSEVVDELYQTHWKNVPFEVLKGVSDSVENIEHVARYSEKMGKLGEQISFEKLKARWIASMNSSVETRFEDSRKDITHKGSVGRWAMAQLTKIPWMASWLDGGDRTGVSHSIMSQPFTDALDAKMNKLREIVKPITDMVKARSQADIRRHAESVFIPEAESEVNSGNFRGFNIIGVALNAGNAGNLRSVVLGEQWAQPEEEEEGQAHIDNPALRAVLAKLTNSDWDYVELVWKQMDSLFEESSEIYKRTSGKIAEKVEPVSFTIVVEGKSRQIKGGYYPIKHDPKRSTRARTDEDKKAENVGSLFITSGSIQSTVTTNTLKSRTRFYDPLMLTMDVVSNHFQEVIHYITHHDAVRQMNKFLLDKEVMNTIVDKLGPNEAAQLRPWLSDIAKDGKPSANKNFIDASFQRLKFGVTLGVMGFNAHTGAVQLVGLTNAISEVGSENMYQALRSIAGDDGSFAGAWQFAIDNSKVMEHRGLTMDREMKNVLTRLEVSGGRLSKGVLPGILPRVRRALSGALGVAQEASMKHIIYVQVFLVDLPTWHAAYIKEMKASGDETKAFEYADWAVENTQGSGATKNLPTIMRSKQPLIETFTMFMTFFITAFNQGRDAVKGGKSGRYSASTLAAKMTLLWVAPVLLDMMLKGEFGGDDDDDETTQRLLTEMALYPVQTIPFARDIANGLLSDYGYNVTPIASVLEKGIVSLHGAAGKLLTDDEITKSQIKNISKLGAAVLGVPGVNQVWKTGEATYEILEEGEDFSLRDLAFGPKAE